MLAAALGCGAVGARAETKHAATHPVAASQPAPAQVEPGAIDALAKMSAYLRTLEAFQVSLQSWRDDVDVYGQLITLSGDATYKVRRPDAMTIDLASPAMTRRYVYDGKTVTVFDPKTGYYAKIQAPSTIRATLDLAEQKYGVSLPLADLFTWAEGDDRAKAQTSAHYVGKVQIGGQSANQYAFRQPGIDWQVWIADGDKPLPLRVAITASKDPARPKFEADLTWDAAPQFAQDTFVFTPPANARAIDIHPIAER
jgi:hypothetical protein